MVLFHILCICVCIFVSECAVSTPCSSRLTCGSCMASPKCSWCSQAEYERAAARCDDLDNLLAHGCAQENIVNPGNNVTAQQDDPLSDAGAVAGSAIQLKPQKLKLNLRPGEPVTFKITFRQAEDYPVDLYYLMDLTWTMKKHKETLAEMADMIADSMRNVTKNFRLGFGSFIDKVVMPFVDMVPESVRLEEEEYFPQNPIFFRLLNPCRDVVCSPPYGFRNHLSLDNDISRFTDEVNHANVSANLDNAEGGFDAIMQAIVCKDKIKWNERSRKMILFATDAIFHYAGDGKLGGIVKPNDGHCHLDENGYYTESVYQDYPSLSQINSKIVENKMIVIFAVPETELPIYQRLTTHIEGSYAERLESDASNVVDLIRDQYGKIQSKVELKDTAPEYLKVKYFSKCLGTEKEEVNACEGLKVGTTVDFEVQVELLSCPKDPAVWSESVSISPVGLNERVQLNLNLLCECDCEKPNFSEIRSPSCSFSGTYQCGICSCDPNHFGRMCECTGNEETREDKLSQCKRDNSSEICSGRGDCVCGVCECDPAPDKDLSIYGQFCECDTFSCERDAAGRLCGGGDHGDCCGECLCKPGWSGTACDCSTNTSLCIAPSDQESSRMCSGRGECICGECKCFKDERGHFGGPFCEDCSFQTCEGRCTEFRPCVQCKIFQSGELSEEECANCTIIPQAVDDFDEESKDKERKCIFKDDDDCSFTFVYTYDDDNKPVIRAKKERECPRKEDVLWIAIGVTAGVFLIGLTIVLVVRMLIYFKDRRDYQKFLDELEKTKWGSETNPIYKGAVSKYQNPIYEQNN